MIDFSLLPPPDVIEKLDFETIFSERKKSLIALWPEPEQAGIAAVLELESEPLVKHLQENAYRELVLRQRINDTAKRLFLSFAKGADLEHFAARYYVKRLVVQEADPSTSPPKERVMESDDSLRDRVERAYESLSVAGPKGAYVWHARSSDGRVVDAAAYSPAPAEVEVAVLSSEGNGAASSSLLAIVNNALNDEDVRPVGDRVHVRTAGIVDFELKAVLHMETAGPGRGQAVELATERATSFLHRRQRLGKSVWLSKLDSLLHVEGVKRVVIESPPENMLMQWFEAARCVSISIKDADQSGLDDD